MHPYLGYANEKKEEIIGLIEEMVKLESPSDSPGDVNRLVDLLVERTNDIASATILKSDKYGNHLRLEFKVGAREKQGQILGIGHSDTVWPLGTLQSMPYRRAEGRLWGPGVLDMKSGVAFFIYAVRALRDLDVPLKRSVFLLVVSDEEVGSKSSRSITEAEAKRSECVLVLEPGEGLTGKLKTSRKGVGTYRVFITGKPTHAGIDFKGGASAILEAARQVERIAGFTNLKRGVTVNPGIISGGTRTNVVAAAARIDVDVRAPRVQDAEALNKKLHALRPVDKRCTLRIEGGLNRPPMERTKNIARLFAKAKKIASDLGLEIQESSTGGGSDGNFTAALGIPTLDGLGGVGEGAHALNESVLIDRIPDRTALLAGLIAGL